MTTLPFYVALTDDVTEVVLTDTSKYAFRPPGWAPMVIFPDGGITEVVETMPIDILGANAYELKANLDALTTMLIQAREAQVDASVRPVQLVIGVPNGQPGKLLAAMVTGWSEAVYAPQDFYHTSGTQQTIKQVQVTISRRHPWVLSSYRTDNLYAQSAWAANPGISGLAGTFAYVPSAGLFYGGRGLIRVTKTLASVALIYPLTTFSVTSGVPVTVTYTAGYTSGVTSIAFYLVQAGVLRSSLDTATVVGPMLIADGRRITATVTPTVSGLVSPAWSVTGPIGQVAEFAEVLVGADDVWHPTYAEETMPAVSTLSVHPVVQSHAFIGPSPARAPLDVTVSPDQADNLKAIAFANAASILIINDARIELRDWPTVNIVSVAPLTEPADSANYAFGGIVQRYTPTTTAAVQCGTDEIKAADTWGRATTIIAAVRNNSATTSFDLWVELSGDATSGGVTIPTRRATIPPAASAVTTLVVLGDIYSNRALTTFTPWVQASAASGSLDIDYFVFVELTANTAILVRPASTYAALPSEPTVVVASHWLDEVQPELRIDSYGDYQISVFSQDDPLIWSQAATVQTLYLTVVGNDWAAPGTGTNGLAAQVQLVRPTAYNIPE